MSAEKTTMTTKSIVSMQRKRRKGGSETYQEPGHSSHMSKAEVAVGEGGLLGGEP